MRKTLVIPIVTGLIGFGLLAAPLAAHAGDTPVGFDLTAGTLAITVPTSQTLTAANVGDATVTGPIGHVVVADDRGDPSDSWTATVVATDFTTDGLTGSSVVGTLPVADVTYALGTAPSAPTILGTTVAAGGSFTSNTIKVALSSTPKTVFSADAEDGSSGASWYPTLTLNLPTYDQIAGTYSGTVTYSVS